MSQINFMLLMFLTGLQFAEGICFSSMTIGPEATLRANTQRLHGNIKTADWYMYLSEG
jgi:hypothetical protein